MKTTININGKPVMIELTPDQVAHVRKKTTDYRDIKTFEDACEYVGVDPDQFEDAYSLLPADVYAFMQLRIIALALNGGMKLRYGIDRMWEPLFNVSRDAAGGATAGAGFCCSSTYYDPSDSDAITCSRLCYMSREVAEYAGKRFIETYKQYLTGGEDSEL